jgi:hypothetical protein
MPGIPMDVAGHSIDIRAGARPVKQHLHRFDEEKRRAIGEEVHKLMAAGFIKEVFHPKWLANPVLVKKKGGKWRMCESAFIPFVSFGDLDNNTFKGLTSLLSVEQEIQYDEHT